jgi:hypothetical protein
MIELLELAPHEWSVEIRESSNGTATTHKVTVSPDTIDALGVTDEEALVREAIETFLDHDVGTDLPHDVDFDWLEHHVEGFLDELTARLS